MLKFHHITQLGIAFLLIGGICNIRAQQVLQPDVVEAQDAGELLFNRGKKLYQEGKSTEDTKIRHQKYTHAAEVFSKYLNEHPNHAYTETAWLYLRKIVNWHFTNIEKEISVTVPTAQEGEDPPQQPGEIVISILPDGAIRAEAGTINLEQLSAKLSQIAKQYENQPVRIRADGKVEYQRIVEVIDTCQKAGIWNISFATQRPTPSQ